MRKWHFREQVGVKGTMLLSPYLHYTSSSHTIKTRLIKMQVYTMQFYIVSTQKWLLYDGTKIMCSWSCRCVYIIGEDCIFFCFLQEGLVIWFSLGLFGAEKAVWARAPGMLFPPRPQGLGTPFSLYKPLPFSLHPCLCATLHPFFMGEESLSLYKASHQWPGPHSAVTPPGLSSICSAPP